MSTDLPLTLLNTLRQAVDDSSEDLKVRALSAPGESDPQEFYIEMDGVDYVVRLEAL